MLSDLARYEKFQDVTNGRIHYYEAGSGDNHTVLLHGMGVATSADTFAPVFDQLAARFHVYDVDALGFGKSTRAMDYGPTFDVIVDGLREFMDLKGIRQANLVGHSAGGWFGAILAYESPARLRRLVMSNSAGFDVTPVPTVSNFAVPTRESITNNVNQSVHQGSAFTAEMAAGMAERMLQTVQEPGAPESLKPLLHQMATPAIRRQYLLQRRLPQIQVPTMMIWGKGDTMDPFPTWTAEWDKIGGDLSKSSKPWVIPGAKYVLMQTGHNSHWEASEEWLRLVTDFLA